MKASMIFKNSIKITGLMACFIVTQAHAEGFSIYEFGPRGLALGNSTMAGKADPSVMATNPALITKLKGRQMQVGFSTISPSGKAAFDERYGFWPDVEVEKKTWFAPSAYYTHQINDDWYFGIGQFSRFGVGFEYPDNWAGRYSSYMAGLVTGSVNANLAWRANEQLSLSAGLEVMYVTLDLKRKMPLTLPGLGRVNFFGTSPQVDVAIKKADDIAFGFNAALHYQINEQWGVGLLYRAPVHVEAVGKGHFQVENVPAAYYPLLAAYNNTTYKSKGTVMMPESISGGIAWSPRSDLTVEAGATWTRWSRFDRLEILTHMGQGVTSNSPKDWDDAWRFNVGVEYEALDWLTLRAGYVFDQSPMTEAYEDYLVPSDDRNIYSIGAGFKWGQWTADIAYAYVDIKGRKYEENLSHGVLATQMKDTETHVFSTAIGYRF